MPIFEVRIVRCLEGKRITQECHRNEWHINSELTLFFFAERKDNLKIYLSDEFPDFQNVEIVEIEKPGDCMLESYPDLKKYGIKIATFL